MNDGHSMKKAAEDFHGFFFYCDDVFDSFQRTNGDPAVPHSHSIVAGGLLDTS